MNDTGFPKTREEALTMLWLSRQKFTDMTPEELHDLYWQTFWRICRDYDAKQENGYFN